jgi:hypothetical protein
MKIVLTLTVAAILTMAASADQTKALFEPPTRLLSDKEPLNQREKLLYPSPVLLDIDGDKQAELVVGDLWGKLRVYKSVGKRGDLTWDTGKVLQAQGKDLVVPNW